MAVCRKCVPGSHNSRVLCTAGVERCVFRVRNGFTPLVACLLAGALDGDVAEPAVLLRAVPVLDPRRDGHHVAGVQGLRGLARLLIPAQTVRAQQQLAAAGLRVMDVPVVAAVNWTPYSQSLVVTGFNGIHVCALCELFVTSSFARLFLCFVLVPNLFCKVEHCPAFWPACIECYVGDNRCDFFLRYPMILGIL